MQPLDLYPQFAQRQRGEWLSEIQLEGQNGQFRVKRVDDGV
jgi:hypothetical protein